MKRSVLRFLNLLLFASLFSFMLCPSATWAQNLEGRYHTTGGNTIFFNGKKLADFNSIEADIDSLVITGGDFTTADWDALSTGYKNLVRFEITKTISSVADLGTIDNSITNYCFEGNTISANKGKDVSAYKMTLKNLQVLIVNKIKNIGNQCFLDHNNLLEVSLPDVECIGHARIYSGGKIYDYFDYSPQTGAGETFRNCYNLKKINLPKVKHIGRFVFKACGKIKNVNLPELKSLGYGAFSMVDILGASVSELERVDMPKIDSIGWHAFQKCESLSVITLGETPPDLVSFYRGSGGGFTGCFLRTTETQGYSDDFLCKASELTWAGIPMPLIIQLSDGQNLLTGDKLNDAINNYLTDPDENTNCVHKDGFWFGGEVGVEVQDLTVSVNNGTPIIDNRLRDVLAAWTSVTGNTYKDITSIEVISGSFIASDWQHLADTLDALVKLEKFRIQPPTSIPDSRIIGAYTPSAKSRYLPLSLKTFVGDSILNIGASVFRGLTNLRMVELPCAKFIGEMAFEGCTALKKIKLPMVETLIVSSFANSGLDSIWMPPTHPTLFSYNLKNGDKSNVTPSASNNPFRGLANPRFMRFIQGGTVNNDSWELEGYTELLPPTQQFKNVKQAYKNHTGYYNSTDKTWLGWTFFTEYSLTVNVVNGAIDSLDARLKGSINFAKTQYVYSEMDSLVVVDLSNLDKFSVYVDDTLKISPIGTNYRFKTITSGDVTISANKFTMPAGNVTVNVEYIPQYTITVEANPVAGGNVSGGGTYDYNTNVTLVATANTGYNFVKWQKDGADVAGSTAIMDITVDGNATYTAVFEPIQYTITVASNIEHGTILPDKGQAVENELVTITATPNAGYYLKSLSYYKEGESSTLVSISGNTFNMPTFNVVITAEFELIPPTQYNITIDGGITNGTVLADPTSAAAGTSITVTVTPASGYRLKAGTLKYNTSDVTETAGVYTFTMPAANVTVTAEFERVYNINIGTITGNGNVLSDKGQASQGETVTLTVVPGTGKRLKAGTLKYNGNDVTENAGVYTFIMPAEDVTITAEFEATYSLTINGNGADYSDAYGTATANKYADIAENDLITITVAPIAGTGVFKSLTVNGTDVTAQVSGDEYSFNMPAGNVTVEVVFEAIPPTTYSLTINGNGADYSDAYGTATANKYTDIAENDPITITVAPIAGVGVFKSLTVNGTDVTAQVSGDVYSFNMPAGNVTVEVVFEAAIPTTTYTITAAVQNYIDASTPSTNTDGGRITINGESVSSKTFDAGDYAELVFSGLKENHKFMGWYVGDNRLSKELTYKFKVSESLSIVARVMEPWVDPNTVSIEDCGPITWNGNLFSMSQTFIKEIKGDDQKPDTLRTISVVVKPKYNVNDNATICAGGSYDFKDENGNDRKLDAPGDYVGKFSTILGCDSTVNLHLTQEAIAKHEFDVESCGPYTWHGVPYSEPNTYTKIVKDANGCDVEETLHLTIVDKYEKVDTVRTCKDYYVWVKPDNSVETYTEGGLKTCTVQSINGCDSIVSIFIKLEEQLKPVYYDEYYVHCGHYYEWYFESIYLWTFTSSGERTETIVCSKDGCSYDSIITLHLTLTPVVHPIAVEDSTCNSNYIWNGKPYGPGLYTETLTSIMGCDSTVTLELKDGTVVTTVDTVKRKAFGSFTWDTGNGSTYVESGTAEIQTVSDNGCIVSKTILDLTILSAKPVNDTVVICPEEFPFDWVNNMRFDKPIDTEVTLVNKGITELHKLHLAEKDRFNVTAERVVCDDTYEWDGQTYNAPGTYSRQFTSVQNGCANDSTVTLTLHKADQYQNTIEIRECGPEYIWNRGDNTSVTFTATDWGTYTADDFRWTGQSAAGCDSTVVLDLKLNNTDEVKHEFTVDVVCDSYTWKGVTYDTPGEHRDTISLGCRDSVVIMHVLAVEQTTHEVDTKEFKYGEISAVKPYMWEGKTLTASGTYTSYPTSPNGCQSTKTLIINVIDAPEVIHDGTVILCQGQDILWRDGNRHTTTGPKQVPSADGSKLYTMDLVVLPYTTSTEWVNVCSNATEFYYDGQTYPVGPHVHRIPYIRTDYAHCDSVRVNIEAIKSSRIYNEETATVCQTEPYSWNGRTFRYEDWDTYTADDFVATLTAKGGCDSIVSLKLSFVEQDTIWENISVNACKSFTWDLNGKTYTKLGSTTDIAVTGQTGCLTYATRLNLNISDNGGFEYIPLSIREDELPLEIYGETYYTEGVYPSVYTLPSGCEVRYELHLTVIKPVYDVKQIAVCENDLPYTLTFNDQYRLYEEIFYGESQRVIPLRYDAGDTIRTFRVDVIPSYSMAKSASYCGTEGYLHNGQYYLADFEERWQSAQGCDSIVRWSIASAENIKDTVYKTLCNETFYDWPAPNRPRRLTQSDWYYDTIPAVGPGSCEQITVLSLQLGDGQQQEPAHFYKDTVACAATFAWTGPSSKSYSVAFPGSDTLFVIDDTLQGCRPEITHLRVTLGNAETTTPVNLGDVYQCGEQFYTWNKDSLTHDGQHTRTLRSPLAGCKTHETFYLHLSETVEHFYHLLVDSAYTYSYRGVPGQGVDGSGYETFYSSTTIIDSLSRGHGTCDTLLKVYLTVIDRNLISGIDDNASEREMLLLHPNPTSGVFYIEAPQATEVMLFGISGQLSHRQALLPEGSTQIDIGHLPAGVYIVRAGNLAAKLVKL